MKPWFPLFAAILAAAPLLRAADPTDLVIDAAGPTDTVTTDTETTITFHDNIVATDNDMRLTCDYLKVVLPPKADPTGQGGPQGFRTIVATGHVHFTQGTRIADCGRADISSNEDRVVLSDHPVLRSTENNSSVSSYRIIFNHGQKEATFEPAPGQLVHAVLPPIKELNLDEPAKPAAATTAPAAP